MNEPIQVGDVVVVQFGPTEWVAEVIDAPRLRRGYRGSTDPELIIIVDLDRAQFGKYATRPGDTAWFSIDEVIAR